MAKRKYIKYILPGIIYTFINVYFLAASAVAWYLSYKPGLESITVTVLRALGLYVFLEVIFDSVKVVASILADIVDANEDEALKEYEKEKAKQKGEQ